MPTVIGKESNIEYVIFKYLNSNCNDIFAEELTKFKLNYRYCYSLYDKQAKDIER